MIVEWVLTIPCIRNKRKIIAIAFETQFEIVIILDLEAEEEEVADEEFNITV